MTELRESFPTLEDIDANNAGAALSQAIEGDTITGRNFHGVLPAKDASDNLKFLNLDANGNLRVTDESAGTDLTGEGTNAAGSASEVLIAKITLQASTDYKDLAFFLSCFRDCVARVVAVDDVGVTDVETELIPGIRVGPGQFSKAEQFVALGKFTSGSTGVQELQILAYNPNALSQIDASLGLTEL